MKRAALLLALISLQPAASTHQADGPRGYYRFPAVSGESVVFTAEGDLWVVPIQGGVAQRLTSHAAEETNAAISPDGRTVAFSASYEGPTDVYTMPLAGGRIRRRQGDRRTGLQSCRLQRNKAAPLCLSATLQPCNSDGWA